MSGSRSIQVSFALEIHRWVTDDERLRNAWPNLPCGRTFSSSHGTIEFDAAISTSFTCLILIEVDDGQNIFLRFDSLTWDNEENLLEIGLFHNPNQARLFRISGYTLSLVHISPDNFLTEPMVDAVPGTWFVASESQLWIRFSSSRFSLGTSSFRLSFSETIQCKTHHYSRCRYTVPIHFRVKSVP